MRQGIRKWTPLEEMLIDPRLMPLDADKNPRVLRCLFCEKNFRFEDEVTRHTWAKHRKLLIAEIVDLRKGLAEAKEAIRVFRGLSKGRDN